MSNNNKMQVNKISLASVVGTTATTFENLSSFETALKYNNVTLPENALFYFNDLRDIIHELNAEVNRLCESVFLDGE